MRHWLLIILVFFSSAGRAQTRVFDEGKVFISGSYGFGNLGIAVFRDLGSVLETKSFGPVHGRFEYAVSPKIGIGVNFAYAHADLLTQEETEIRLSDGNKVPLQWNVNWNTWSILARLNYHFGENDIFDPYLGFGLGFKDWTTESVSNDPDRDIQEGSALINIGFESTFGLRVMPHERIGIFTELGLAKSLFQIGITARL